jgi:hypothetical protein
LRALRSERIRHRANRYWPGSTCGLVRIRSGRFWFFDPLFGDGRSFAKQFTLVEVLTDDGENAGSDFSGTCPAGRTDRLWIGQLTDGLSRLTLGQTVPLI